MQICKLCSGEIKVPEGESVLKICTGCVKRTDLEGDDLSYQLRQKAVSENPKVTVYAATNVPKPEPTPEPAPEPVKKVDKPVKKVAKPDAKKAAKKTVKKLTPMKSGPVKKKAAK